ncbi:serine/threonine-protein kinase [Saccharomonospora cyanea]|uniref:non-specific serine/threonine protein kinase n=1 Tax=Saccharomonospora cyanea NA-134 TaxID=882082 RepID=H5XH39_9PSEU|nr:serine/threonine-protein kinase [Saccharomonospora cyanea]EHR59510.1 protein kinase family protein [Saccharomonospora cyanea NA-134]
MSDEGRLVAGRYRVIKRIGTGAMGAVWQAHDEVLHRTVAIKQLLLQPGLDENEAEDARQRTMREGRIAARLHHPHAITVFDVVTDDNGQPCLIMEYLPSTSLAQELQTRKTLPPIEVAKIGAQIAAALKEAHAVGIVHRDIKPGNILLADNGVVKITDFGISRAKDDVTVTKTGMIAGTPAYLAPEVAVGGDPGPESDVFSLGSTLYAASEGQPPFGLSENTLGLLHAVAAGQINPPRRSGPLTSVLAVMLHPDVSHRPTAAQCEELLAAVARGETPLGGPGDEATRAHRRPGGGTAVLGAAGAGAVGGALGAAAADYPDGHSGQLDDRYDDSYDAGYDDRYQADEYYDEGPPTAAQPRETYDDYDEYERTAVAPGPQATRAVPADTAAYDDDRYDDRYDERGTDRGYDRPPPGSADDEEKGNWKVPAVIGAVVVIGMAAFVIWIFGSGGSGNTTEEPGNQLPEGTTQSWPSSTSSSEESTTTTTEETVEYNPAPTAADPGGGRDQEIPVPTDDGEDTTVDPTTTDGQPTSTPDDSDTTTPGDGDGGDTGTETPGTSSTTPPEGEASGAGNG